MPIVLLRVDERLIHGQVVVGWGNALHAERMIVVDDDLAGSDWEQELYVLGVPGGMEATFVDVTTARQSLREWRAAPGRSVVLLRDVATLHRLAEGGALAGLAVNLGGIHHAAGRRQVLPYLFLSPEEEQLLRNVADSGVTIAAQDLPASRRVSLDNLFSA